VFDKNKQITYRFPKKGGGLSGKGRARLRGERKCDIERDTINTHLQQKAKSKMGNTKNEIKKMEGSGRRAEQFDRVGGGFGEREAMRVTMPE